MEHKCHAVTYKKSKVRLHFSIFSSSQIQAELMVLVPTSGITKSVVFPSVANSVCRLHMLYAKLEEEHGLARHALSIYNRATKAVEEKADGMR